MSQIKKRRIGIVGGMGPAASNYFAQKITELAPATSDQDHPVVVHISNPKIPDRTAFLVGDGEDPVPEISKTIAQLDMIGVDIICIPCNTAHAPQLFSRYTTRTHTRIAHMVDEAMTTIQELHPEASRIAILGTDGTKQAKSYDHAAQAYGFTLMYPEASAQRGLMELIYAIKRRGVSDEDGQKLHQIAASIPNADVYVLACTELSMLSAELRQASKLPVVDSLECLARAALNLPQQTLMLFNAPTNTAQHGLPREVRA